MAELGKADNVVKKLADAWILRWVTYSARRSDLIS